MPLPLLTPMKTFPLPLLACGLLVLAATARAQTTVTIAATDPDAAETVAGQPANPGNIRVTRTGSTANARTVWVKVSGAGSDQAPEVSEAMCAGLACSRRSRSASATQAAMRRNRGRHQAARAGRSAWGACFS